MTTVHGLNLLNYFFILILLSGADYLSVFNTEQINSLVMLFLIIHVFALGYLVDSVGILLLPAYETTPALAAVVIAIAEITFPLWLLVKDVHREGYQERVTATK